MNATTRKTRFAGLLLALVTASLPAAAQVCKEKPNDSGMNCDMAYRNTELTCSATYDAKDKDNKSLKLPSMYASCPAEPMRMRSTEKLSFIKDFSPYLYDYLRDEDNTDLPYSGYIARGTKGDAVQIFSVAGNAPEDVEKQNACVNQIQLDDLDTPEERAKAIRLQLDNCANQFILWAQIRPFQKAGPLMKCPRDGDPHHACLPEDACQPLRMITTEKQEYTAGTYIEAAWKKLLQKPEYRLRKDMPHEPALPKDLKLTDPIDVPDGVKDIVTNAIAAAEYEEIVDPSHPFSPRWDYENNDRDKYSPKTASYSGDSKNSVFCAGTRNEPIKVDILTFRDKTLKFDEKITKRIDYNAACKANSGQQRNPCCRVEHNGTSNKAFWTCVPLSCSECYGMTQTQPACSTDYLNNTDRRSVKKWVNGKQVLPIHHTLRNLSAGGAPIPYLTVARKPYSRVAACNPKEQEGPNKDKMADLCKALRAPFTPLNKLKMRYHEPEGDSNKIVLNSGVPDGLSFRDYFADKDKGPAHMPYPRLWDTGTSIQKSNSTDQMATDTLGQYTAIVGVGREGHPGKKDDQRCLYGGWGGDVTVGGYRFAKHDPITSWTELKLYQAYTAREAGLVCLGRYEKVFKQRSSENRVLISSGGVRKGIRRTTCTAAANGTTKCDSVDLAEAGTTSGTVTDEYSDDNWPLAWRGYMGDGSKKDNFAEDGRGGIITGLSNAQCGDYVLMPNGGGDGSTPKKRGLPKVARVYCHSDGTRRDEALSAVQVADGRHFVQVVEADNGKSPDVCGTTNVQGELISRYLYKPGEMKPETKKLITELGGTTSCVDTGLTECEMEPWDSIKLYRPIKDMRDGSDHSGGTP